MQKLAFGALFVGLLVACGGGNNDKVHIVDTNLVDDVATCNVLTQTGCNAGEKCTWIHDATTPTPLGHIGCSPDGTAAVGAACSYGPDGPMGYDTCVKSSVCVSMVCKAICDQNGGAPTCGTGFACGLYTGLFDVGGMTAAGVCDKTCDPLADNDFDGSGADVKTGTACAANQGCYGFPGRTIPTHATCTGEYNKTLVHRSACSAPACAPDSTHVYLNGCAQGYIPLMDEQTGSTQAVCIAMCKPANCYMGVAGSCPAGNQLGMTPHKCDNTHRQGTFVNTESCFYSWAFEYDTMGNHVPSPTSDSLGYCIDHAKYAWDSNGNGMIDAGDSQSWPACSTLAIGSAVAGGHDATYFGCVDTATATAQGNPPFEMAKHRPLMDMPRAPYHIVAHE